MKNIDFKKYKKQLIIILVLILIMGGFYYYQDRGFELEFDGNGGVVYPNKKIGETLLSYQERIVDYEKEYIKYMEEFDKQDNYGAKTPEETLDLYIEALEIGDFDLASKYFVLKDQEKELGELSKLEEDVLKEQVTYLKVKDRKFNYNDFSDTYEVEIFFEGKYYLAAKFVKNKETDIWKLESM